MTVQNKTHVGYNCKEMYNYFYQTHFIYFCLQPTVYVRLIDAKNKLISSRS